MPNPVANNAPFPVDPTRTAIAIAYTNPDVALIADEVCPVQGAPIGTKSFTYYTYPLETGFVVPETTVGRKGRPNELEYEASEASGTCVDYGLDAPIPMDDITQAQASRAQGGYAYDPVNHAVEQLTNAIRLDRERRVAALAFDAASYPDTNKTVLSGTGQFSDYTNSDPLPLLLDALDTTLGGRPNQAVMGSAVWSKLRRHPKLVKAIGSTTGEGVITRQQLADLLEIGRVLVGAAYVNSARRGQTPALTRVWGKSLLLQYIDRTATNAGGLTHMLTVQYGTRMAGVIDDPHAGGLRGGRRVRVGESVKELIIGARTSYLFADAVA